MIHKVFRSKAVYIRPSTSLPVPFNSSDSEDSCVEVDTSSANDHTATTANQTYNFMTTRARGAQLSLTQQVSRYPFTRRARANQLSASQQGSSGTMTRPNQPSASQQGSSGTMTRANQPSASQQGSSGTMTRANQPSASQQGSSGTMTRANQPCASPQGSSGTMTRANQHVENVATVNQIQSDNNDDYATYLSIMGSISDLSSDGEELSQAIMASLESHV
ncbi:uncharacterized protein LOC114555695 isoform X2 [Perca flavescens]|uniref:uncharacterized protein LOC114555695 isoform X2 n=1 Tax=Perca flavescens TaxID=8167 RepID=UPI00106EB04A|nr:uncharacterized protein LOC114555695 isoform X2 [Perca flavescens]